MTNLVIGYGAMTQTILQHIELDYILVRPSKVTDIQSVLGNRSRVVASLTECIPLPDLAVECAGHGAIAQYGVEFLAAGVDFAVVSVGALADQKLFDQLKKSAQQGGGQLQILAGAVTGIDALSAARVSGLDEVLYTARKRPASWRGTPAEDKLDLDNMTEAQTFYQGNARQAAQQYPANANVAATIALAGLGFEQTQVQMIADPDAPGNVHHLQVRGSFGQFSIELQGKPLANNPKTSTLAALSALRALRHQADWLVI